MINVYAVGTASSRESLCEILRALAAQLEPEPLPATFTLRNEVRRRQGKNSITVLAVEIGVNDL